MTQQISQGAGDATTAPARPGSSLERLYDGPMRDYPLYSRALLAVVIVMLGLVTKILWPWRIEDGHKLWDDERGRVLIMNHQSMLDPVVVVVSLWFHHRRVRCIYKSEFDTSPIVRWLFAHAGGIPVARGTADMRAIRRAQHAVERGEYVLIYPEGTRVKSDDQKVEIHKGFSLIARLAKAPVQPIAIVGARDITPKGRHLKRLGRVYLRAGDCIEFKDLGVTSRKGQAEAMERRAMGAVFDMVDALRREHPGKM
ncbi:1-acyl-sn-glycerol-3-phosphate acyltransferase [Olsenella sp. HMSC062G07]|uniref:lysophospholipid acyltransferase family protein n=1 Tax=Olsenella sp. HMSC062G07 TaxID=1739330 RepID=UPI0008CAAAEA|nr:lysophospholipid acyltransferase family protein [Olsenella sp. HMSC062G07]OFK24410.1 hypothetical protein HMPREF2826_07410 [Olsenella sp. HMSC062G07]